MSIQHISTPTAGTLPAYAELHCLSNFSFQHGASHPEELVQRAHALGYSALAITDECSMAGVVRAHTEAKKLGLPLLIGTELRINMPDSTAGYCTVVLIARNRHGYGQLCELITAARAGHTKRAYHIEMDDWPIDLRCADGTQGTPALTDVLALLVPRRDTPAGWAHGASFESINRAALWLRQRFPTRAWLAAELVHQLDDDLWLHKLREVSRLTGVPLAAAGGVRMHLRSRKPLLDVITAVKLGQSVADCGLALAPNAERHLRSRIRLASLYPEALLAETSRVASKCQFSLDALRYEYPEEVVPVGATPASYLRRCTYEGAGTRYPGGIPASVQQQVEHELALITELKYEKYFLTVYDIVQFARSRHILCQGRGSAANSAVCYCLGITEVDPSRMSTLFERFISRERNEPPDIDVDFEHQRREEVIQYLYSKYGRERAALTATAVSYRPRSAIRDVGKALGLDAALLDSLAKGHQWWDGKAVMPERLAELGLDPHSRSVQLLLELTGQLMGFPRQLSQHPGGFVLTGDRLTSTVPVIHASMPGRTTIEWDKDDIDALGLLKVDVLALGMLSALRRALDLIGQWRGQTMQMQDIPAEDSATYDMVCKADTVGVFQIESRAQQSMLPRLQPRCFYDLVVEVAIVRPGPIQGGMVHPYLRRRQGLEPVHYPSEALKAALERTLGVPIFQEQVMQIAMLAAGFSADEADSLRRSMAAWKRKGGVHKFYDRIITGMTERGYTQEFAEQIFSQIEGFGEYGFPESHAASFALLVYASCWIKCHEPAIFLAALLNSQPMGFYGPSQLVQDAKRHGVEVRAVDVMHSDWDCTLEQPGAAGTGDGNGTGASTETQRATHQPAAPQPATRQPYAHHSAAHQPTARQPAIRLGLRLVSGLKQTVAERIVLARSKNLFNSTQDLALQAGLDAGDLKALASADALASLSGHRRQQVWDASALHAAPALLKDAPVDEDFLELEAASEGEEVVFDYAALGVTLRKHPVELLRPLLARQRLSTAAQLHDFPHGKPVRACGLVTMRQQPGSAKGVVFVTLEDESGTVNVIVWKSVKEKQREPLLRSKLLAVYGQWQREGEVRHLIAQYLVDMSHLLGRLSTTSRDFR
jgi:error-prone DNA polymerase